MEYIVDKVINENFEMPYIKFGRGQKIFVVIPGMSFRPISASPEAFVNGFSSFGEEYTVYLFDRKSNMEDNYYLKDMENDTLDAIKQLGLKNIYLYGASQGGMICQMIAIKYPKLVKKMILASTTYYNNIQSSEMFNEMMKYCDQNDPKGLTSYFVRKLYSKEFSDKYKDALIKMYEDLSKEELHQYRIQCNAYQDVYLLNDLSKITAKTLIIVSQNDAIFGYESSLHMALKLNCEVVLYDEYGHCVYDEAPDFIDRIKKFFNS